MCPFQAENHQEKSQDGDDKSRAATDHVQELFTSGSP